MYPARNLNIFEQLANLQRQIDRLSIVAQSATGVGYSTSGGGGGITNPWRDATGIVIDAGSATPYAKGADDLTLQSGANIYIYPDTSAYLDSAILTSNLNTNGWGINNLPCVYSDPSRALGTNYHNSTKPRVVFVVVQLTSASAYFVPYIGSSNPASTSLGDIGTYNDAFSQLSATFIVPPNYYYRVVISSGSASLVQWTEYDLF
jgi:hypothetical protein